MALDSLPPIVPAFEITVASQGMSKGTLQSEGAQFILRASLKIKQFQLGAQWKNVTSSSAKGEALLFGGWSGKGAGLDLNASLAYKILTSTSGSGNRKSWEMTSGVARKFGKVGLKASAIYSPDDFGATNSSFYVEGGPSLDLPSKLKASANIGHRWRKNNRDYTSFNAGLARALGKNLTLDVRYYDTDKGEFGETFDNRVVVSVKFAI